jgi:hypothetical protein
MKHRALEILHRLREYALEQEERKLMDRQKEELAQEAVCRTSLDVLQGSYNHSVASARAHDYQRRDGCVREAGVRHNIDMRRLGLAQIARRDQLQAVLQAKTRADMISKVLEKRRIEDEAAADMKARKELDDLSQGRYVYARANDGDDFPSHC